MTVMRLKQLLEGMTSPNTHGDLPIFGLTSDSRKVRIGDAFCAYSGATVDGRAYIQQAINQGASVIIYESGVDLNLQVPAIAIDNLPKKLGYIASRFYGDPSSNMEVIGVTGTNGKTSYCHFLSQALMHVNNKCAIGGTLGNGFHDVMYPTSHTTLDPISLQAFTAAMHLQGAKSLALEVSSHALSQHRVAGMQFNKAVFTNLSQDHLDYHHSMQAYGAAKKKLFEDFDLDAAIINSDDPFSQTITAAVKQRFPVYFYSTNSRNKQDSNYLTVAKNISTNLKGLSAFLETPWGNGKLKVPFIGLFNLYNLMAVLITLNLYGVSFEETLKILPKLKSPRGRMQIFQRQDLPTVVVDYAHTPDALKSILSTLIPLVSGKLWIVFGAGGDRCKDKRKEMGAFAEEYCDQIILTNDNPRYEDPILIAAHIAEGIQDKSKMHFEPNRAIAIEETINKASPDDMIVIAGKGAEEYQVIGDKAEPFCDIDLVEEIYCQNI